MPSARAADANQRVVVPTEQFTRVAAERIAHVIKTAVARTDHAHVALAGGNTPRAVYRELSQMRLPWDRVEIYFGDERAVPPSDAQSNYRMARETLMDAVPIPPAHVYRIAAERGDLDAVAQEYAALLPDRLDLIILGIGEDGHTASLFPGSPALNETARKVVVVDAPKPPRRRLTVTPPVIASARARIVLAAGAGKATAVEHALNSADGIDRCPAQLARDGTWILDRAAAGRIHGEFHAGR